MPRSQGGFTLIEVVVALTIIGLVTAVAVPAMARRLDAAYRSADLAQIVGSARLLPVRAAAMGAEIKLDAAGLARPMADGQPPLDLPPGWTLAPQGEPPQLGRAGICTEGNLLLTAPAPVQSWRLHFDALSCALQVVPLEGGA
ncbi:MAG: type II secretion system protein [Comamonadaceae bacterium]|jgi:prepilin-type N-terminal cleavage/methylation domain-containing protein|nr:type II secretion system protein [Comamonadaceae bacterium]